MAIELEKIKSWDGQSGTGADNRGVIDRNFEKVKTELEENKAEIVQLVGELKQKSLPVFDFTIDGYLSVAGGGLVGFSPYKSTDYIPVVRGLKFYNEFKGHQNAAQAVFYDQFKKFISSVVNSDEIIIPENVSFVRFSTNIANSIVYSNSDYFKTAIEENENFILDAKKDVVLLGGKLNNTPIFNPSAEELSNVNAALYRVAATLIPQKGITANKFVTWATGSTGFLNIRVRIFDVADIPSTLTIPITAPIYEQTVVASSAIPLTNIIFPETKFSGYPLIVVDNIEPTANIAIKRKSAIPLPSDSVYAYGYYNTDGTSTLTKIADTMRFLAPVVYWNNNFVENEVGKGLSQNDYIDSERNIVLSTPSSINLINERLTGGDIISLNPTEAEMEKDAEHTVGVAGMVIRDTNVSFDRIYHAIGSSYDNDDIEMKIYLWDDIKTGSNIDAGTPIYTQIFKGVNNSDTWRYLDLYETINANGKYVYISFDNLTNISLRVPRKTNKPLPSDSVWVASYYISGDSLTRYGDNYRYACPRFILTNNLLTKSDLAKIQSKSELHNNLTSDSHLDNLSITSGVYGAANAKYEINLNEDEIKDKGYIGFEFRVDENMHDVVAEKEIINIDALNGNSLKLILKKELITPFKTKQILYQHPSDTTPEWDFQSEYPLPYYNSQFIVRSVISGVTYEMEWAKRNPREWKPLVGNDAFSLQFKPPAIRGGTRVYADQVNYEANQNWYLDVLSDRISVRNADFSKTVDFLFLTYPTVDKIFEAVKKETLAGGQLQDFVFESLDTGVNSYSNKAARPCTDLLQCSLKLVDKFPYQGTNASASKVMYDGWAAVVPYWKDESLHSFEIATDGDGRLYVMIDGKPSSSGETSLPLISILSQSKISLGVVNGLATTFFNFESYAGSTNGYQVFSAIPTKTYIASKKNPRVVGVMWHDVIPSDVVTRPTTWADVPKYMRVAFSEIVNATWVGAAPIYYRGYGQFTSEPVLISGNIYEVNTIDDLTIRGEATIVNSVVTQIKATEIVAGTWSERTFVNRFEGVIIRVGDSVCHSTGFLQQCFNLADKNGYKMMTWRDVLKVLRGEDTRYLKVWAPQFDDYSIYMFTISDIRKVFNRNGLPISVAWDLGAAVERFTNVPNQLGMDTCNLMRTYGHETVIHNHWRYSTSFVSTSLSDEAEMGINESIEMAQKFGTDMTIWDQSQNLSTPLSQKLMELCGIEMCISTQGENTTRATNRMYASRTTLNNMDALSEKPLH